jgi:tight adherence protein B
MMRAELLVGSAAALAILAAGLQEVAYRRAQERERVVARVEAVSRRVGMRTVGPAPRGVLDAWLEAALLSIGIAPRPWFGLAARALALLLLVAGTWLWGLLGGLLLPLAFAAAAALELARRRRRRRALLLGQLPALIEYLMRALQAGGSMPTALASARFETPRPLRELLDRIDRQTRLGAGLEDALDKVGAGQGLPPLDMVVLALRLNQRYGGSMRDILGGVVASIRQRERAQREVRALSAETRLSAWILALLPTALGAYIVAMNTGYLTTMWADPTGRVLISAAIGLQVVGSFLIWRMVRSI